MATAKKAAPTKTGTGVGAADMRNPLKGMAERLQNIDMTGSASKLLESGRKDLQALMQANEKSYKGLQTVVQRQTEMIKAAIGDWQATARGAQGKDMKENMAKLDEMGRASFQRAIHDIKELADLAAKSQKDAFDLVRERIQANVDEVTKLLQRK